MLKIFSKDKEGANNKKIENLVLILVLFIIGIVLMNVLTEKENEEEFYYSENPSDIVNKVEKKEDLEEKLEEILSFIKDAGKVDVLVTYENSIEQIPMYDTKQNTKRIEEMDKTGGTRKTEEIIQEKAIIFEERGNEKNPVIQKTTNPKIVGVLVVAEGAGDFVVKENLMKAVEATLNVPSHRIQVFARKNY